MSENLREEDDAPQPETGDEDEFELPSETLQAVRAALSENDRDALMSAVEDLHDADLADLIEQLNGENRRRLVRLMGADLPPDVLIELDESTRDDVLEHIQPEVLAKAARELETDDVVYLLEDLEEDRQREILDSLDSVDRIAVERSLEYPEYSAGRLMQREVVTAPAFWTVGQVIDMMRAAEDLPETFYEIIVIDPAYRPVGSVGLSKVMAARRPVMIESIMTEDLTTFDVDQPQEEVAYAFNQYHLVSAPVVDGGGRLVGVITIDDAMGALEEETEEDLMRLGGVGDESLGDAVGEIVKRRFPWLFVNLLTAIAASAVISMFDATIEKIVALAVLMTIVASMGGNAGTQTLTVAVRAIATRDLTRTNAMRVVMREVIVGLANGLAFAVVMGGLAAWWYADVRLGLVLGLAMIVNMLVAALAGILVPMGLDRVGADPALASGVFVTTVTDVVGFFVFLGIAGAILL